MLPEAARQVELYCAATRGTDRASTLETACKATYLWLCQIARRPGRCDPFPLPSALCRTAA